MVILDHPHLLKQMILYILNFKNTNILYKKKKMINNYKNQHRYVIKELIHINLRYQQ